MNASRKLPELDIVRRQQILRNRATAKKKSSGLSGVLFAPCITDG